MFRDEKADIVKAGSFTLTTATGFAAAVVALGAGIDPVFEAIFGKKIDDELLVNEKAAILIAVLIGWVIVVAVDILARSYVTAQQVPQVSPLPTGLTATCRRESGRDEDVKDCRVLAVRTLNSGPTDKQVEFLLAEPDGPAQWVPVDRVDFAAGS